MKLRIVLVNCGGQVLILEFFHFNYVTYTGFD